MGARAAFAASALWAAVSRQDGARSLGAGLAGCRRPALLALGALLALAACGDLPQPYRGRPGREGARLSVPLALRLAVPPPPQALLPDVAARQLADALADALLVQEVPAVATAQPWPLDWRVDVVAAADRVAVAPRFRLLDADGREMGVTSAAPVPVQDWANPTPELFKALSADAAPRLANLLLQVEAARKAQNPAALTAGPPRMRFTGVTGAPGDGNVALARQMQEFISRQGYVIQDVADGATYGLSGTVNVVPASRRGLQRVEILWKVTRRDGEELGQVLQINEVPNGSLNRPWGDVAYVVAEEASGGVIQVIRNALGEGAPPAAPGAAPAATATPAGGPVPPPPLPSPPGNPLAAPPRR